MTKFFYDTEFHEDGTTIDLISFAMVSEHGDELHLISADADWTRISAHPWLAEHVLPHLPGYWKTYRTAGTPRREWRPDGTDPRVMPKRRIAEEVERFISAYGSERKHHQLWAWYGAYDHVALAQLFGRMIDLPECIPMHTNDLRTLAVDHRLPAQEGGEHDALADARWVRDSYNWLVQQRARDLDQERKIYQAEGRHPFATAWATLDEERREKIRHAMRGTGIARLFDSAAGIKYL